MGILKSHIQQIDTDAFLWMQQHFCQQQSMPIIRSISFTGDGWLYVAIAALVLTGDSQLSLAFFYSSLLAYAIQVPAYILLKKKFKRNRPQDFLGYFQARIKPSDQFSFPSGHTAAAFVMATQIFTFFPEFGLLAVVWASAIGLSRILLGVHFPGDILAGLTLGAVSAFLANSSLQLAGMN